MTDADDRAVAHAELASERWEAHREKHRNEREFITERWTSHDTQHENEEKALSLAVRNMSQRLDELNKLREEVTQDRAQFIRVEVYDARHSALITRVDTLERLIDRTEGAINTWRFIASFLGLGGVGAIVWAIVNAQP